MSADLSVSVVIITRNRPQMVRDCLDHLRRQTRPSDEIIVVDSSPGEETQAVLDDYPEVVRLRIPNGRNNRPEAKNLGIAHATGDVVAFLDDDSMAATDWLEWLLKPYADPEIGGVGGRVLDVVDQYEQRRVTPQDTRIGVVGPTGWITTNFALDVPAVVEVDHFRGCNMSFRKAALKAVNGFDTRYILTNVLEETDLCVRVKRAGWRLVFQPRALVNHLSAPREEFERSRETTDPVAVIAFAHNRAYFFFTHFGFRLLTARHILVGMWLVFFRFFLQEKSFARARAVFLYALGAWWGLVDSLVLRLRHYRLRART